MKARLLRRVSLALGLSGLVGCFSHLTLGGLAVTIVDLKPAAATAPEAQAVLTVCYANENVVPIGLTSSKHRLFLNGSYAGNAASTTPAGLPMMAPTTQAIPVQFENPALVRQLANAAGAKTVSYRLESDLLVMVDEDHVHVRSSAQGTLDLSPLAGMK